MLTEKREKELVDALTAIRPYYRTYWCESQLCGCLGCVNRVGRLPRDFTKEEWAECMRKHPELDYPGNRVKNFNE